MLTPFSQQIKGVIHDRRVHMDSAFVVKDVPVVAVVVWMRSTRTRHHDPPRCAQVADSTPGGAHPPDLVLKCCWQLAFARRTSLDPCAECYAKCIGNRFVQCPGLISIQQPASFLDHPVSELVADHLGVIQRGIRHECSFEPTVPKRIVPVSDTLGNGEA